MAGDAVDIATGDGTAVVHQSANDRRWGWRLRSARVRSVWFTWEAVWTCGKKVSLIHMGSDDFGSVGAEVDRVAKAP